MRCRRAADSSPEPRLPPLPPLLLLPRHPTGPPNAPTHPASHASQARDGLDTVDANLALGLPEEARNYEVVPFILHDLGVTSVRLLTNNPFKLKSLRALGVQVDGNEECQACEEELSSYCRFYLSTKATRMKHMLSTPHAAPNPNQQAAAGKQPDATLPPQETPPQQSWLRSLVAVFGLL